MHWLDDPERPKKDSDAVVNPKAFDVEPFNDKKAQAATEWLREQPYGLVDLLGSAIVQAKELAELKQQPTIAHRLHREAEHLRNLTEMRAERDAIRAEWDTLREELVGEMRAIQLAAGQCSVEGPADTAALMAAAEAERCQRWADRIERHGQISGGGVMHWLDDPERPKKDSDAVVNPKAFDVEPFNTERAQAAVELEGQDGSSNY